jgi:hypothetical protein
MRNYTYLNIAYWALDKLELHVDTVLLGLNAAAILASICLNMTSSSSLLGIRKPPFPSSQISHAST